MEQNNTDLTTRLSELARAAEPYTSEEMRIYDDNKDETRLLATAAKYALEHPNPNLSKKK